MKFLDKYKNILLILTAGFLMRLVLARYGTYQLDHNTFIAWGRALNDVGYQQFYSNVWSDYLPGYLHVLRWLAYFEKFEFLPSVVLYKLPAIFGDILITLLIYLILIKQISKKAALFVSSIFLFNPAVLVNSTMWGQVDIFSSLFPMASIYFLGNPILSAVLLGIGGSIKPQAAMAVPVLLALMLKNKWSIPKILIYGAVTSIVLSTIFLPFNNNDNLINFIIERVSLTMGQYPYGSVNAFNLWGLWGFWKPDNVGVINHKLIGSAILILLSLLTFKRVYQESEKKYEALAFLLFANFLFLTRMHERHMLPMLAPLIIYYYKSITSRIVYVVLSITYILNIAYAYQYISPDKQFVLSELHIKAIIIVNLIIFVIWFRDFINKKNINYSKLINMLNSPKNTKFSKDWLTESHTKKLLMIILLFAFVSRVVLLWHPNEYYFDEIYHEFTARQILINDWQPWDWMSRHPEGFAYEWTHPPLGKEIMAASMFVLGENHFAARLPGAILGVGVIFLTFLIAKRLTKRNDIAVMSAFFLSTDGLIFTMSRIATVDIYFLFFSLATLYYLLKEKHFLSSVMLGFAIATKWSTLWLGPILLIAIISQRLKLKKSLVYFTFIPIGIYLISYLPMFMHGFDLKHFWGMQQQMWWYHSGLEATHPYTSTWWSWPLNWRPVYLYQYDEGRGMLGNIYAMGNPFFFWSGLVAVLFAFYGLIRKKLPHVTGFVLFAYLAFFVPWALSPRIMFIYHYLPSLPFLAIILAIISKNISKKFTLFLIIIFLISFIYFFPHWTGIPVPEWLSSQYYWLKSWR